MTSVAVLVHPGRADAIGLGKQVASWVRDRGLDLVLPDVDAGLIGSADHTVDDHARAVDLVVAIGGDGTVLRAARRAVSHDAAILGVNLGQLGYLAEIEPGGCIEALEGFLAGRHHIDERLMVQAELPGGELLPSVLNEVVVEKLAQGRTIRLGVRIDGEFFTSYVADGLIVATPTGSTAYSLSARGPIVAPSHRAILLTPVSPHSLFDRSLVLGPDSVVSVDVLGDRDAVIALDGQDPITVEAGSTVTIRAADRPARFVSFGARAFHQVLKAKFGLNDR